MKERTTDIYGVKVAVRCHAVKYVLPWRRHGGNLGNRWVAALAVVVCLLTSLLPVLLFMLIRDAPLVLEVTLGVFWFCGCNAFTALFSLMAWSAWSHWGRCWIWISRNMVLTVQLRGDESWFSMTRLEEIKRFSTLPDGDDRHNPATPARLLAELDNNVKRLFGDYPIDLVDAMVQELTVTARRIRKLS